MSTRVSHYASTCEEHFEQKSQKPHENHKIQNQHFFGKTVGKHLKWHIGGGKGGGGGQKPYFGVVVRIPPTRPNSLWCA